MTYLEELKKGCKEQMSIGSPVCAEGQLCSDCELEIKGYLKAQEEIKEKINDLMINCPIQKDKECWCKPLEILYKKLGFDNIDNSRTKLRQRESTSKNNQDSDGNPVLCKCGCKDFHHDQDEDGNYIECCGKNGMCECEQFEPQEVSND